MRYFLVVYVAPVLAVLGVSGFAFAQYKWYSDRLHGVLERSKAPRDNQPRHPASTTESCSQSSTRWKYAHNTLVMWLTGIFVIVPYAFHFRLVQAYTTFLAECCMLAIFVMNRPDMHVDAASQLKSDALFLTVGYVVLRFMHSRENGVQKAWLASIESKMQIEQLEAQLQGGHSHHGDRLVEQFRKLKNRPRDDIAQMYRTGGAKNYRASVKFVCAHEMIIGQPKEAALGILVNCGIVGPKPTAAFYKLLWGFTGASARKLQPWAESVFVDRQIGA